jgi:tetratricopeptide (TPR) repeat protein/uncharacterized membrane protein YiaA
LLSSAHDASGVRGQRTTFEGYLGLAQLAWSALPIAVVLISYAAAPTIGFVWDDQSLIVGSPLVTRGAPLLDHFQQPFWSATLQSARAFYRPLITLSYAADFRVWHGWAGGFHITNVLLHLACTLLVSALCRRAGASRSVAAILAGTFAAFPRLTESVAWISGRTDVAAAVFGLSAVLVFQSTDRRRFVTAAILVFFGLLCKEVALAAVVAIAIGAWQTTAADDRRRRLGAFIPMSVALAAYGMLRWAGLHGRAIESPPGSTTVTSTLLVAGEAVARYATMLVDPLRPRLQIGNVYRPSAWLAVLGFGVVVLAGFLTWRQRRRLSGYQWMALGLGSTAMAMVLHIVPFDVNVVAADRFLYLPVAALAIFVAPLAERLWQRHRRIGFAGGLLLIALFAVATSLRVRTWSDDVALWRVEVAHVDPANAIPYNELGIALIHRARYAEALEVVDQVRESAPHLVTRATCLDKVGRRGEAIALLRSIVENEPGRVLARINLILMAARERQFDDARAMADVLPAELRSRSDLRALRRQIEEAAAEWATLPPASADEAAALRARRATWFERLGAIPEATALWSSVVFDHSADEATRLRGATFLATQAPQSQARAVLATLAEQGLGREALPSLVAALAARFEED